MPSALIALPCSPSPLDVPEKLTKSSDSAYGLITHSTRIDGNGQWGIILSGVARNGPAFLVFDD